MVNIAESSRYFLLYMKYQYLAISYPWCDLYAIHKKGGCPKLLPETCYGSTYWFFSLSTTRSLSMWIFPLRFLNIMKWVFFKFKDYLLMFNQSMIFIISLFICSISLSRHFPERNKFESSANRRRNKTSETLDRSLICSRNNNGPRVDPWGTPHAIFLRLELVSL